MELTKHGHACVVLSDGDRRLVIDPGAFTDPAALDGAAAVLITHEHPDHFEPRAAAGGAGRRSARWRCGPTRRWPASWRGWAARVHVVGHGDAVTVAGFDVHVHGELHARDPPGDPADPQRRVPGRTARCSTPATR